MDTQFSHYSVMLHECMEGLNIRPDGLYIDCTAGGGGHSSAIASLLNPEIGGHLIAIDQDPDAIAATTKRLSPYQSACTIVRDNFSNVSEILARLFPDRLADGVLIDLGVSSHQLDTPERGFSYMHDAPLDMRMNPDAPLTAADILATYSEHELTRIIRDYGEERFASRVSRAIVRARQASPIRTTAELVSIVRSAIPSGSYEKGSHPEKRTFQAIRIEVNHELEIIEPTVHRLVNLLAPQGRLVILTFHSLEDRAVKQAIAEECKGCTCPPDFPICVCGKKPRLDPLSKKPLLPSEQELNENSRSHSAKLRIAQKL